MKRGSLVFSVILAAICFATGFSGGVSTVNAQSSKGDDTSLRVHAFYYPWYANAKSDGFFHGWRSETDLGAVFYPKLGPYSISSDSTLAQHMRWLKRSNIGVICVSWWGKDHYTDKVMPKLLDWADRYGIKVNFHLEPFQGRTAETGLAAIKYIIDTYGSHPAFYRHPDSGNRPLFYIYDAYQRPAREWARLFDPRGDLTVRGTKYDIVAISLWVGEGMIHEHRYMLEGCFDGFYTYFAADGFVYGSTIKNWPKMMEFARENNLIFIPCAGPGYDDSGIRTWNVENLRERDLGRYYSRMFQAAIAVDPPVIGVTSFNEWFEGTQIEPSVPRNTEQFTYADFEPLRPEFYLDHTAYWVNEFRAARAKKK